jgi:AraC-like DNA-binding protein
LSRDGDNAPHEEFRGFSGRSKKVCTNSGLRDLYPQEALMFAVGQEVQGQDAVGGGDAVRATLRHLDAGEVLPVLPSDSALEIIMVLSGRICARDMELATFSAGDMLLLAQPGRFPIIGDRAAEIVSLRIPRLALQAEIFGRCGVPRRVARVNAGLGKTMATDNIRSLSALLRQQPGSEAVRNAFAAALIEGVVARERDEAIFPVAQSVQRALARLTLRGEAPALLDDLVRAAGVTYLPLRRAVKETTGVPLTRLLQDAQLDWARSRLQSNQESRALGALAEACGFRQAAFSRAYQRRFGETPTQTRTRAFQIVR